MILNTVESNNMQEEIYRFLIGLEHNCVMIRSFEIHQPGCGYFFEHSLHGIFGNQDIILCHHSLLDLHPGLSFLVICSHKVVIESRMCKFVCNHKVPYMVYKILQYAKYCVFYAKICKMLLT